MCVFWAGGLVLRNKRIVSYRIVKHAYLLLLKTMMPVI